MFLLTAIIGVLLVVAIATNSAVIWLLAAALFSIDVGLYAAKRERK